jgi:hypothetical protein
VNALKKLIEVQGWVMSNETSLLLANSEISKTGVFLWLLLPFSASL